ncbi:ABC transporter permease [Paenibacillus woosongensis]|uniref:ABC transporter permease n=1 Tax=Paenibacillus woosongensis TaxID=307580 RepID=A0AA95L1M3_9BACL|nr:ABC transporter permease [Paenibacillus woosongensis]WHX48132.1 ABC transporter permease [Paenibacillus woosongensis]
MIKLMKLELKKHSLGWYFSSAFIASLCIIAILILVNYVEAPHEVPLRDLDEALVVVGAVARVTCVILGGVLVAKLIVEEYKSKTIFILFSYPISRKKLLGAKLLFIAILTFITVFVTNLLSAGLLVLLNSYLRFIPGNVDTGFLLKQLLSILTFSVATAGTSLIPLYFGMRKSIPCLRRSYPPFLSLR